VPESAPSVSLGDFEITLIQDGVYWWDGGAVFGVVPKTLWNQKLPADELNRVPLAFNCYLVRTDGHTILIETGGGDKMDSRARERMRMPAEPSRLPEVIARAGVDPESVDLVINSHLHWDHCSGNTVKCGGGVAAAFPRARYFAPRAEWEHAHERNPRDSVSYIDANYDPLVENGQMILVDDGHVVVPGVTMHRAPGHNRDMMVVTVESQGATFCFLSDLVPGVAHLQPTWIPAFDLFPLESIETRTTWLRKAVEGDWLLGLGHDCGQPFVRIRADEKQKFALKQSATDN